ncbi:uncharacterized protein LOC114881995 isoform X1 [Osmia bicornis bicornis]|uniref:uncharacterized protein LOC114881995 isoform X1 n=1 Tax=Osmia bicornis bicornis TaxID=1437191 RepID=UPI001EAE92D5|nr:uncharacterized protein LOC114881995 isoform X1 [Osmia bicornis bicornis]XP_046145541.1 uncharacterized protein LOC114881995 isoform X1 [Osmia bicornis bicornis]XP_046145542.1 uncharacterized protein LOC114881995 isoform X1 [Osmia bicornis bicornis]XP_046145543.1 uncharacterized protein LOC114881995 isoform X1 [Osmia bicornis bicornis]
MPNRETRSTRQTDAATRENELLAYEQSLTERERHVRETERRIEAERLEVINAQKEKENLRAELEKLRREMQEATAQNPERVPTATTMPLSDSPRRESAESSDFTLKEAVNTIPIFDGHNISVLQFCRACRRAKEIVPPRVERTLARLILTRLRGRAALAIEDEFCETVTAVCNRLKDIFQPSHTINHFRGEIANIFMKPNEHILDFIGRVKDLREAMLDCNRQSPNIAEIDDLTVDSFINGLNPTLRTEVRPFRNAPLLHVFDEAIRAYKQSELDQTRYGKTTADTRRVKFANTYETRDARSPSPYRSYSPQNTWRRSPTRDYRRYESPEPVRYNAEPRYNSYRDENRYAPRRDSYREGNRYRETEYCETERQAPRRNEPRVTSPSRYVPPFRREQSPQPTRAYETRDSRNNVTTKKSCSYCQRIGHDVHECKKRAFVENDYKRNDKYANNNNSKVNKISNSGNGQSLAPVQDRLREVNLSPIHTISNATETKNL